MRRHLSALALVALVALWFAGCSGSGDDVTAAAPDTPALDVVLDVDTMTLTPDPGPETVPEVVEPEPDFTWHRDIQPIFETMCVRCHQPGAMRETTPLTSYEDVAPWVDVIGHQVENLLMPPWQAASGCADYRYDESLTEEEIAKVVHWVDDGGPEGDPEGAPIPMREVELATLSREDVTIQMTEPYTPQVSPDDYRCFLLPWPHDTTQYITGFGVTPGNVQVVHHVAAFLVPPGSVAQYQAWDDEDPEPGYSCFGGPSGPNAPPDINLAGKILYAWSPGGSGNDFPEGTGMRIEPGSYIALQIHYNTLFSDPAPDQSTVSFKVDAQVEHEAFIQLWANPNWYLGLNMDIPAGEGDVTHTYEVDPWNFPQFAQVFWPHKLVRIYQAALHMHLLGTHATAYIDRPDGTRDCLLDRPSYDFNWQRFYILEEYVELRPGDRLGVECHFDNSPENQPVVDGQPAEPIHVNWGQESGQEMCMGFFFVVTLDE